jgi:hypothetical protein
MGLPALPVIITREVNTHPHSDHQGVDSGVIGLYLSRFFAFDPVRASIGIQVVSHSLFGTFYLNYRGARRTRKGLAK